MSITNSNVLDYILDNRMSQENGEILLQEKKATMGHDAIGSARAWMYGRFLQVAQATLYKAFMTSTFDDLTVSDLTELSTVRAAYLTNTGDADTTETYVMLFEAFVELSLSKIWEAANMDAYSERVKRSAEEYIVAIVGALANPDNALGSGGAAEEPVLEAVVVTDVITDAETKTLLGGYE